MPGTVEEYRKRTGAKPPKEAVEALKKHNEIKSKIMKCLREKPKTIPEIAGETGIPSHTVTWYVMTLVKYKVLKPIEKTDEGYWRYGVVE